MATREREPQGYEKLSRLQKFILVALMHPKYAAMPRPQFTRFIYQRYFEQDQKTNAARASVSRAYRRLEERGFVVRTHVTRYMEKATSIRFWPMPISLRPSNA